MEGNTEAEYGPVALHDKAYLFFPNCTPLLSFRKVAEN
jgi:hypothetical protein